MNYAKTYGALQQYQDVGSQSEAGAASPHRLVQMLMEGALDRIAIAKGHMLRGDIGEKGGCIGKAIGIIDGLRASLNTDVGGEVAANMASLYDYMEHRLLAANVQNDPAMLDEVAHLLGEVKAGWDAIADTPAAPPAPGA